MFKAEGYFEGSKSEWKRSWQIGLVILITGFLMIFLLPVFIGDSAELGCVGGIVTAIGILRFLESYFSGIGIMGVSTGNRPATFYNVKKH